MQDNLPRGRSDAIENPSEACSDHSYRGIQYSIFNIQDSRFMSCSGHSYRGSSGSASLGFGVTIERLGFATRT